MKIAYHFDEDDFLNFQSTFRRRKIIGWLLLELIILGTGLMISGIIYLFSQSASVSYFLLVMMFLGCHVVIFLILWMIVVLKLWMARRNHQFGPMEMAFTEHEFRLVNHQLSAHQHQPAPYVKPWSAVKRLRETRDYYYLVLGMNKEIIVPKRAFPTMEEVHSFQQLVTQWIKTAKS